MTPDWMTKLKADPTEWLLEPSTPAVRFFTLRDILGYSEQDTSVKEAKLTIPKDKIVKRIFARQKSEGYWEALDRPYLPKYKSTYWQIMILAQLGLDNSDARIRSAVDYITRFQMEDGGFTASCEAGFKREYAWVCKQASKRRKTPEPFETWAKGKIREEEMSCLTGNVAAALIRLGYAEDLHVRRALEWLVAVQNPDGGWLCPYWKAHIRDTHGCFMATITTLDAFAECPEPIRTPQLKAAAARGAEFLLMHHLFKSDHHGFRPIKAAWLQLSFPWLFYDIVRALTVVTKLGHSRDPRIDDALEVLLQKQRPDGTWILENTPNGRMQTNIEAKGQPSKWVTLHALQVVKRISEGRP
jgi:hypothetical protein